jgi:phage terminase Nu1 subunit (DNA packaging protein)
VPPRPAPPPPGPARRVSDEDLAAFIRGLPEDQIPELNESRARREHYQAEKARLEALQGRGELVPAADVKRQAFELARAVRDELGGIPDRVASMLAACSDVRQVHRMLSEEIRVALRGLSDG